jgi:hypothetical protein
VSSLPKSPKDGLESFTKLVIPTIIHLKNKIKHQVPSVKVEQGKRFVEEEAKLHKSIQNLTTKIKQEQGEGFRTVGTNFYIYDGLAIMKVEQVSQGEGYVKIGVDLKHTNKFLAI